MIHIKTPEDLLIMREAGRIVARALAAMREAVRPGITTAALDKIATDVIRKHDAIPTFLGYPPGSKYPFPATINASVNNELVHGIPGSRVLQEGDIISLDCGATYKGFVGDSAFTMAVGKISAEADRLIKVTEQSLKIGIETARVGHETKDISLAIQQYVEGQGYSVVREYTGHGVGRNMHEDPQVPNWWPTRQKNRMWRSYPLRPGMTFALEPMVIIGKPETKVLGDHWTVVTADGTLCAHTEHTIAVTDGEPLILTLL
ncbi:MAG: type I methionyl aminopeptidase [Chloroflexota bacterium]